MNLKSCWCGNSQLKEFSPEYFLCSRCGTLVLNQELSLDDVRVRDDENDLYSKEYWLSYQTEKYGYPDIHQRSRQDISERCLYWLNVLMSYKLPPGYILELGCAHGGSVALAKWAGFEAMGLEMSPWVVNFAQKTFDISLLLGPLEDQNIEPKSLDAIVLYDVLEHLPDPLSTMAYSASLLKEDGIFIVQTPNYIEDKTYLTMLANQDYFLDQLKPYEHIYLFSRRSVSYLFQQIGFEFLKFEPPLFDYDMYFIASRHSLVKNTPEQIANQLIKTSSGRLILALMDQDDCLKQMAKDTKTLQSSYLDVLKNSEKQQALITELTTAKEALLGELTSIQAQLRHSQEQLPQVESQLSQSQNQLADTLSQLRQLQSQLQTKESELHKLRAKIEQLGASLNQARLQNQNYEQEKSEQIRQQLQIIQEEIDAVNSEIGAIKTSKFWRLKKL
jgi:2-polyprenyl-3-methyl-5-hydroxy-6-metoxy-1,4-benzoquinol methylase